MFNISRDTTDRWLKCAATGSVQLSLSTRHSHRISDWDEFVPLPKSTATKPAEMAHLWQGDWGKRTMSRACRHRLESKKKDLLAIENGMKPNVPHS